MKVNGSRPNCWFECNDMGRLHFPFYLWRILERDRCPRHSDGTKTFIEAVSVFEDPLARIFDDPVHSAEEIREIIIGHSIAGRLLLVCFTEPLEDEVRILSAPRVTKREKKDYEECIADQD